MTDRYIIFCNRCGQEIPGASRLTRFCDKCLKERMSEGGINSVKKKDEALKCKLSLILKVKK